MSNEVHEWWEELRSEIRTRITHLEKYERTKEWRDELVDVLEVMQRIEAGKRGEELR